MLPDTRVGIVNALNEVIGSLDTTLSHPGISHPEIDIGQIYLNASKMKLSYILENPASQVDSRFTDPLMVTCKTRSENISRLAGESNWHNVLEESYKMLIELPGEPSSEPGILPPPPDIK